VDEHDKVRLGLEIGCGESRKPSMIGLDIRRTGQVDVIADARMLPFMNGAFDYVFSSHLVEHFSHREVSKVLAEWVRVLKKDGTIEILCPDLRARAFLFFLNPSWQNVKNIYGEQNYVENQHRCGFSFSLLKHLLESCGIRDVRRIIEGYKGIPLIPECLHVKGVKH